MDNSYYQAGGSGTFGLAWSNEAPAIHQDMIEGRLDHVPAINKLDCWLQLLLTAVLCLHLFDLNFKGLDFSACQAVYFQEFARGHESHPSLLPHHLTCSVRVCVLFHLCFLAQEGNKRLFPDLMSIRLWAKQIKSRQKILRWMIHVVKHV